MMKDGLHVRESLRLKHIVTGQDILVFHRHQTDPLSDVYAAISRFVVRNILRHLLRMNLVEQISYINEYKRRCAIEDLIIKRAKATIASIEKRLRQWAYRYNQMIICGHTHQPIAAKYDDIPYFNTGNCIEPGLITGLEIVNGAISQIRWVKTSSQVNREIVTPSRQLSRYMCV
jgi:UDP-2,3-diacylglucosamine pyrophosphatase LpxH